MKPDQERVRHLLTDTVTLLCKNGLNYQKELRVQGLLGITLDDSDVFVVHINETFGDLIGGAISVHADDDNTGQQTVANIDNDNEMELGKLEDNATMTVCRKKKDRDRSSDSSNSPAPSSEGTPNAQEIQRRPIKRLMTNLSSNTSRFEKRALLSSSKMNTTVERSAEMDAGQTHLDLDVKVKQERSGDDLQSYGDHVQMVSSYPTLSLSEVQGHYQTMDDVGDPGGGGEVPQRRNITQGSYDDSMSASAPQTGSYMLGSESCMQESVWDSAQMSAQGSGYAADGQSIVDPSCSSWDASQSAAASTQAVSATEPSADSSALFGVVEFVGKRELAIVPARWLRDDDHTCMWPSYDSALRITQAVQNVERAQESWARHAVVVLHKAETFAIAQDKYNETYRMRKTSQQSDEKQQRKRRRPLRYRSDSEDDGDTADKENNPGVEITSLRTPSLISRPAQSIHVENIPPAASLTTLPRDTSVLDSPANSNMQSSSILRILQSLDEIKHDQQNVKRMISSVTTKVDFLAVKREDDCGEQFDLPLKTVEDVLHLEERLEDKDAYRKLVRMLSRVGSDDLNDTVKRVLMQLLANPLACQYNWAGKGGLKQAFGSLRLSKIVSESVRGNPFCSAATDGEIESRVKIWLRNAPDRNGGRKERMKRDRDEATLWQRVQPRESL